MSTSMETWYRSLPFRASSILIESHHPTRSKRRVPVFGHNGSFLVFRKLAQDVKGFQSFVERATRNADGSNNPDRAKLLSAKMISRWPSGAPLTLAPVKDNPELGSNKYRNNDFGFAISDHDGFACPVGSHIRRANPTPCAAAFPPYGKLSLNIANRHRIIRRGRPYREASAASGNVVEQGLLFLAINVLPLVRQFEFIQQSWLNNPKFNGLYDERDPRSAIVGGDAMMTMQAKPVRERLAWTSSFRHGARWRILFLAFDSGAEVPRANSLIKEYCPRQDYGNPNGKRTNHRRRANRQVVAAALARRGCSLALTYRGSRDAAERPRRRQERRASKRRCFSGTLPTRPR